MITVLTHDPKFDVPLLEVALRLPEVAYVGAMGSRRTHDDRLDRLREAGLDDKELERLSSPIGLDLGARTPEETAISIAAEIIAGRWGGSGERLGVTRRPDPPRDDPLALIVRAVHERLRRCCSCGPGSGAPPSLEEPARRRRSARSRPARPSVAGAVTAEPAQPSARPPPTERRCRRTAQPLSLPALMRERLPSGRSRGSCAPSTRPTPTPATRSPTAATALTSPACCSGRTGEGPFPGSRAQPRLHRAVDLRHRPGAGPRAGLAGPGRVRRAAHRLPRPRRRRPGRADLDREPRLGYARDSDQRRAGAARSCRTSTPTGSPCSAGRWAAASPSTRWSPQPGLVDAAVIYASSARASSTTCGTSRCRTGRRPCAPLFDRFGTPREEPRLLPRAVLAHATSTGSPSRC